MDEQTIEKLEQARKDFVNFNNELAQKHGLSAAHMVWLWQSEAEALLRWILLDSPKKSQ